MNTRGFFKSKWLICSLACIAAALFLLVGSLTFFREAPTVDTNISLTGQAYLSFSSNYASVGTPLTVSINGADPSEVSYEWIVGETHIKGAANTYTPTAKDLEKFITVTATFDTNKKISASLYCSKLPVIYINANETIGDEYVAGTMAMQGNAAYNKSSSLYFGDIYLKLRGNSTRYREKAPYKIKLGIACDLLGMGNSRHWVLIANDIDHTFIRNKLVYDFSSDIGASYAAQSENVVLILNNEYRGVYQLCEQIRVEEERVDIFNWEGLAKKAAKLITQVKSETEGLSGDSAKLFKNRLELALMSDLSWASSPYTFTFKNVTYNIRDYVDIPAATGGFLLEMDFYNLDNPNGLKTNFQQPFYFNTPEYGYTNNELRIYARNYIQSFEYALHSYDHIFHSFGAKHEGFGLYYDFDNGWIGDVKNVYYSDKANDGKHYSEFFDMDSLIVNFFVCEFSMNWDSMKNSVFITKDIDSLAELCPAWDFDWAFGNENMYSIDTYYPTGWHTTNNYFTNEQYYQSVQWNRYLVRDPYFLKLIYDKYQKIRPTVIEDIIKDGGVLDTYYEYMCEAGTANDSKWHRTYAPYMGKSYTASMNSLKQFILTRIDWMDKQFSSFEALVESFGYYKPSDKIAVTNITANDDGTVLIELYTSVPECSDIILQINGTTILNAYSGTDGVAKINADADIFKAEGKNLIELHGVGYDGTNIEGLSNYFIY